MTRANSPAGFAGWARYATAKSAVLQDLNIHRRLTLCFIFIIVLMLVGDSVLLWQLHLIRAQMDRLNGVDEELIEVLRVHTGLLSFYENLSVSVQSKDSARLLKESAALRTGLLDDTQRTQAAFSHLPPEVKVDPTVLPTLESIERTLPSHLDAIRELAASGEWEAARIRLERQVQPLESLSSELVREVVRAVEEQRAQAAFNIARAERRVFLAVPITGFLTLLIAAGLGVALTRSITEPLGRLVEGSKALARGEFQHQVSVMGKDELAHLSRVFNETTWRLRDLYETLRRSESYLAEAQSITHTGSWVWEVAGRDAVHLSDEWYRIYGFDPAEGMPVWEKRLQRIHPADRATWAGAIERAIRQKADYKVIFQIVLPDGAIRWIHSVGHPVLNSCGDLVQFVGTSTDITDRKRAEEALRESEQSFRLIVNGIAGLVAITTAEGAIEFVNNQVLEYFGKSLEELKGWTASDAVHPDDLPNVVVAWRHSVETGDPYDVDHRLRRADGAYLWRHARGLPLRDTEGRIVRWYILLTDIDERKRAEEKLRRSEEFLLEAQRLGHAGSWEHDLLTGRVTVSPEVFRIYGIDPTDDASNTEFFYARFHPEDRSRVVELFERSEKQKTGFQIDHRIVLPDGTSKHIHSVGRPVMNKCGEVVEFMGTGIDVTEHVHANEKLLAEISERKRAEESLRLQVGVLQYMPAVAWTMLPDGTLDFANQQWLEYTGQTLDYVRSSPEAWMTALHPDDHNRAATSYWHGVRSGQGFTMEARFRRARDGTYRWHLNRAIPLRDSLGNLIKLVGTSTDIEDLKRAEEALHNTQAQLAHVTRVMAMGEIAASIAHEVNQPLSGVVVNATACLNWLAASPPNLVEVRETVQRIVRDGRRAGEVIARIRALATKRSTEKERVDLNETIQEAVVLVQGLVRRNKVALQMDLSENLPLVLGDRIQLQQVVLNLVVNGIEAMAKVASEQRKLVIATQTSPDGTVEVVVRDSGAGLDIETMQKIFEAFYTTKPGGMGMGLSISRTIVNNHGGRLWATRNDGPGITLHFTVQTDQ